MSRIRKKFQALKATHRSALIPYVTPEFPVRGTTVPLVLALEEAGADLIELGIPFSDPIADGPTIQHSSQVALRNGVTLAKVLSFVSAIRHHSEIPIILMGYYNSFYRYGLSRLCKDAASCGVDGVIVPDLPPEEAGKLLQSARPRRISVTFLIAPTTPPDRIRMIDRLSTEFTYCVSVTGVTGERKKLGEEGDLESFLRRVQRNVKKPFVVGFGVSKREHVNEISQYADGAVVGSALLKAMEGSRTVSTAVRAGAKFFSALRGN